MITEHPTGLVTKINDPAKAGRIRVLIAELEGQEWPEWIEPIFPAGWVTMPKPGDIVELVLPEGEDKIEFASEVKYRGRVHNPSDPVPDEFKTHYGERRGYKTPGGHLLIFDDTDQTITITTSGGLDLKLDDKAGTVSLGQTTAAEEVVLGTSFMSAFTAYINAVEGAYATFLLSAQTPADVAALVVAIAVANQALALAGGGGIGGIPPATGASWKSQVVKTV